MAGDTETHDREDGAWREVRHYAYVDRPFADVGQLLASAPERVVGHPGVAAAHERLSDLHVRRAGIDMSRDVQITMGGIVLDEDAAAARLGLRWEDARRPKLFPVLEAALELAPLTAGRHDITQIGLVGRYRPPFGLLGTVADTLAGRRVVMESVERFIDDLAARIEAEVPPRAPVHEAEDQAEPVTRPSSRRRRVFLPVDGLERRPGGALALRQRLAGLPGVAEVEVDAVAGMAVVDYDATTCGLTRLLKVLDEGTEANPAASETTGATI